MAETNTNIPPAGQSNNKKPEPEPVIPEKLLNFQIPEVKGVTAYLIKDKEGKIIARTEEELSSEKS